MYGQIERLMDDATLAAGGPVPAFLTLQANLTSSLFDTNRVWLELAGRRIRLVAELASCVQDNAFAWQRLMRDQLHLTRDFCAVLADIQRISMSNARLVTAQRAAVFA